MGRELLFIIQYLQLGFEEVFAEEPFGGEEDQDEEEDGQQVEQRGVAGLRLDEGLEVVALVEEFLQLVNLVGVEHLCTCRLRKGVEQGVVGHEGSLLQRGLLHDEVARRVVLMAVEGGGGGIVVAAGG